MPTYKEASGKKKSDVPTKAATQRKKQSSSVELEDNRPDAIAQRQLKDMADKTPSEAPTIQAKPNNTGLPDHLKTGVENLSGHSMDDVKVHYKSGKPAQLNAHAYAQGTEIHLGPGQEKHLPHEAWHVVQQKQGRVKPTVQLKSGVPVNDDAGLEKEADNMGTKAQELGKKTNQSPTQRKEAEEDPYAPQLIVNGSFTENQPIQGQFFSKVMKKMVYGGGFYTATNVMFRMIDNYRIKNETVPVKKYKPDDKLKLTLGAYEAFNGYVSFFNLKAIHVWLQLEKDVLVQRGDGKADQTSLDPLDEKEITGEQANALLYFQSKWKLADLVYLPLINDCHTRIKDAQKFAKVKDPVKKSRYTSDLGDKSKV